MNKLILLLGLVLVGCEVEVKSELTTHDSETIVECKVEVEVMHESGAINTINPIVNAYNDCSVSNVYHRFFITRYSPFRLVIHGDPVDEVIATSVASYNIIKAEKVY